MNDEKDILKSYDDFCNALAAEDEQAHLLLWLQDLFLQSCICDPRTGEGRYCDLETFLDRLSKALRSPGCQDRLSRIAEHTSEAIREIVASPHDEIRRKYRLMPIHAVREVDSVTTIWLSRQPGHSMREKLMGKRSIKALSRRWEVDTSENRLFKAFLQRIQELFEKKEKVLKKEEPSFQDVEQQVARWLMDDDIMEIGRWDNLPPNNMLLSDKNYRKIWDGWTWLTELDSQMAEDRSDIDSRTLKAAFWSLAALLHEIPSISFIQLPCLFSMRRLDAEPLWPRPWCDTNNLWLQGHIKAEPFCLYVEENTLVFYFRDEEKKIQANSGCLTAHGNNSESWSGRDAVKNLCHAILPVSCLQEEEPIKQDESKGIGRELCIMDVSSLRPEYYLGNTRAKLPYRLMGQIWDIGNKGGRILLDCGTARGLLLTPENPVITSQDIFYPTAQSEKDIAQASLTFFEKIHETISCRRLHYIIPDNVEDFSLSTVRRQIKLYFPDARPLPRSIGAIFAFQYANQHEFDNYEHVLVLVGSLCGSQLVITPLVGNRNKELSRRIPESGAFLWERHPSYVYDEPYIKNSVAKNVPWEDKEPLSMMNIQPLDITDLAGDITLYTRDGEKLKDYAIPDECSKTIKTNLHQFRINSRILMDVRKKVLGDKTAPCYFLPADCPLNYYDPKTEIKGLKKAKAIEGGKWLAFWEDRPDCPELWKDHLPELYMRASINGSLVYLQLVKQGAIKPLYGKTQELNTVEFTLSHGQDYYHFPLSKNKGGTTIRYEAQIHSPTFPLKDDVPCKLRMCYTYGAEKPYQLFVLPKGKAPFQSIEVDWVDEIIRNSPVPPAPISCTWQGLRHFKGKNGDIRDLIDSLEDKLSFIHAIVWFYRNGSVCYSYKGKSYERVYIDDFSDRISVGRRDTWREDRNGKLYTYLTMPDGRSIHVHQDAFPDMDDEEEIDFDDISEVSFDIFPNEKDSEKFNCRNLSYGKSFRINDKVKDHFRKPLRFEFLQIWKDGRSVSDVEAPQSLRKAVKTFHTDLEYIIHSNDMDPEFIGDCLWCAARMHKDAPNVIWNILLDVTKQEHWSLTEDIMLGSALGNFSLPQQKALHKTLLDLCKNKPKNRKYLSILSQAYWRCPSTVSQLDEQEINTLVNALYREFKHRLQKKDDRHFPYNITTMCELLLALLRTRGSDNPEIKNILDANGENSKKFKEIIDNIINIQQEKKFPMKSFIQLELKKPDTRKTMPDLLYAVDMYLTGEDGTDDIVITGVKDAASDE